MQQELFKSLLFFKLNQLASISISFFSYNLVHSNLQIRRNTNPLETSMSLKYSLQ